MLHLVLITLLATTAWAGDPHQKDTLSTLVQKALPSTVQKIKPGETSKKELEKLLGKPISGSSEKQRFYQLSNKSSSSNDLTIGLNEKNKVRYFYHKLSPEKHYPFETFKTHLPPESLKKAEEKLKKDSSRPGTGRTFDVPIPKKGLVLKFDRSDKPMLRAVLSWKPGEEMP